MFTFKTVYDMYKQDVFYYLLSLTHNSSLSEDLTSETFLGALKAFPSFKNQSSIKTWLFAIARNKWLDHLKKDRHESSFEQLACIYLAEGADVEEKAFGSMTAQKIMDILSKEKETTKDIVIMRVNGHSFSEIAKKHRISESSARVIDHRTRQKIKKQLIKEGWTDE